MSASVTESAAYPAGPIGAIEPTLRADQLFIDFRDVWLAYNDELLAKEQFAVEAIDLKVRQGEFIAIVGPSGCGKSTFMKLATGLRRPSREASSGTTPP